MAGARVSDHALKHPVNQLIQRPPFSRPNNRSRDPRGPGRRAAPLSERLRLRFAIRVAEVFMDVTTVRHASSTRSSHGVEQHGRIQSCAISRARMPPAWFMSTRPESSVVLQVPHIPS